MITAALIWIGGAALVYFVAKKKVGVYNAEGLTLLWLITCWSVAGAISVGLGQASLKVEVVEMEKLDARDGAYLTLIGGSYRYYVKGAQGERSVSQGSDIQIFEENREGATLKTTKRMLRFPENLLFIGGVDYTFEFRVPKGGVRNPQIK